MSPQRERSLWADHRNSWPVQSTTAVRPVTLPRHQPMTLLRVIQPDAVRAVPLFLATSVDVSFGEGFYEEERDGSQMFRWVSERGVLEFDADSECRYLEYWASSEFFDLSQTLSIAAGGRVLETAPLRTRLVSPRDRGPRRCGPPRPDGKQGVPARVLPRRRTHAGLRIRGARLHKDSERYAAVRRQHDNTLTMRESFSTGGHARFDAARVSASTCTASATSSRRACTASGITARNSRPITSTVPFTRETLSRVGRVLRQLGQPRELFDRRAVHDEADRRTARHLRQRPASCSR